jgi:hypothetical protein
MATAPNSSKKMEFAIAAIASPTPSALSTKARSTFDVEAALPSKEEFAAFSTPAEAVNFMKQRLLLAGVSTNLWKDAAKPPSYRDITSATVRDTTTLTASQTCQDC